MCRFTPRHHHLASKIIFNLSRKPTSGFYWHTTKLVQKINVW